MKELIIERIRESIEAKTRLLNNIELLDSIEHLADTVVKTLQSGHKLVICGNGGSASDALHFAGEIVGRFQKDRMAWPVVVLNSDVATMTAIANDYGYNEVFARQAQGQCRAGDLFIGISTSGNSNNILKAAIVAKGNDCQTAALLGNDGGKIKDVVDCHVIVPCDVTARIQEIHILIIHILCEIVEQELS